MKSQRTVLLFFTALFLLFNLATAARSSARPAGTSTAGRGGSPARSSGRGAAAASPSGAGKQGCGPGCSKCAAAPAQASNVPARVDFLKRPLTETITRTMDIAAPSGIMGPDPSGPIISSARAVFSGPPKVSGGPPAKASPRPKISIEKRADVFAPRYQWLLQSPRMAEYQDDNAFMGSAISATQLVPHSPPGTSYTTSRFWGFGNQVVYAGVSGLYGCTSVVLTSERGAWISRSWEVSGFLSTPTRFGPQISANAFRREVIDPIMNGTRDGNRGLNYHTGRGGAFDRQSREALDAYIITPVYNNGGVQTLMYPEKVAALQAAVQGAIGNRATVRLVGYYPSNADTSNSYLSASGKALVMYTPWQLTRVEDVRGRDRRLKGYFQYQTAMSVARMEGNFLGADYWTAHSRQEIPDAINNNLPRVEGYDRRGNRRR